MQMILLRCLPAPAMPTTHPANLPITTRGETIEQKTANMTPAVNFRQHIDLAGLHSKLEPNSSKGTAEWRNICEMALTSWKAFPFFAVSKVPVPADGEGLYVFDVCMVHA
jgi:hypothetical protein